MGLQSLTQLFDKRNSLGDEILKERVVKKMVATNKEEFDMTSLEEE